MIPVALTIAGSDPSGGAGIQADLKTFHQFEVYGTAAITLITVQNTKRVSQVEILSPSLVAAQVEAVLEDLPPKAVKIGALGDVGVIRAIAQFAFRCPLVIDPVILTKHGTSLLDANALEEFIRLLLPAATLLTPNLAEAAALAGMEVNNVQEMREAARRIALSGVRSVLVKGGHLEGAPIDILYTGNGFREFSGSRYDTPHTHGTGCTYSAAITAGLARGLSLEIAIERAKAFIDEAVRTNPGIGGGSGPVNHWAIIDPE